MIAPRPLCVLTCTLAVLFLSACGGGGGGGGGTIPNEALLDDAYFMVAIGAYADAGGDESQTLWGMTTLDGMGGLTGTYESNFGGVLAPPTGVPAGSTYTVAADRATDVLFGGLNGYSGWTDVGGDLAITSNTTAGNEPATLALVRLGSGYSDAVLENFYRFCAWGVDTSGDAFSLVGSMTLNGTRGTGTAAVATNTEGTVVNSGAVGVTYSVASNGQVTLDLDGLVMEGVVFRGGEALLLAGATDTGSPPVMFAAVRTAAGLSEASFSGTYTLVGMERDGSGFASILGTVAADGLGGLTSNTTRNQDGVLGSSGPDVTTYEVTSDGGVTIDPSSSPGPIGAITQDGNVLILGGPPTSGNPAMYVLLRR